MDHNYRFYFEHSLNCVTGNLKSEKDDHMNIHEYQAKELLKEYGANVSAGRIVFKAEDAKSAAGELDGPLWVVKAQIHAGGRGKGSFKEAAAGQAGGVRGEGCNGVVTAS